MLLWGQFIHISLLQCGSKPRDLRIEERYAQSHSHCVAAEHAPLTHGMIKHRDMVLEEAS